MSAAVLDKAHKLIDTGYMPVPLHGKVPVLTGWQEIAAVTHDTVEAWSKEGKLQNIGLRTGDCGLVVLDFDGKEGWWAFMDAFGELGSTYTVATGSGNGMHLYYIVDGELPRSTGQLNVPGGKIEIKAKGRQVVVPPSVHPETGAAYAVFNPVPPRKLTSFEPIQKWIDSFNVKDAPQPREYSIRETVAQANTPYAKAAMQNMVGELAGMTNVETDDQNTTLNEIAWKLAHFVARGDLMQSEVFAACEGAMRANGYIGRFGYRAFEKTFQSGFQRGMADTQYVPKVYQQPAAAPRRQLPGHAAYTPPVIQQAQPSTTPVPTALGRTRLVKRASLFDDLARRLNDDDYVPASPPIIFPLQCLHKLGGQARVTKAGKLIAFVGSSGSGKTSALETIADAYVAANVPVWMWTPEWTPDEMAERAMQRYGGPSQDELYLHDIDKWRVKTLGMPSNAAHRLSSEKKAAGLKALDYVKKWSTDITYLENTLMTVDEMSEVMGGAQSITPYPRVLIVDYAQLLKANDSDEDDSTMYNMVQRFKGLCVYYGLVGIMATQTTKEQARLNIKQGAFKGTSVLNVTKNSRGQKGKVRVKSDPERLRLIDSDYPNQTFSSDDHYLGSQAGRFINDDAFNLWVTLNPEFQDDL